MATIEFSCPKCEKQIKAPADLVGKKIRCKECLHVFVVKKSAVIKTADKPAEKVGKGGKADAAKGQKGAVAVKADDPADEDGKAYGVTDHDFMPRCAYCAKELEEEGQVVCLNCGYNHRTRERINVAKTYEPTGGEWFIHLLPGIVCALVTLMLLGGIVVFW